MKRRLLFAAFSILLLTLGCQKEKEPLGILAEVDDRVITLEDFNRAFEEMKLENQFAPVGDEALLGVKQAFLDQLIEDILILKEAERFGISVTQTELEAEIMEIKKDYRGESLRDYLQNQGISFDGWKERVRKRILIEKTIRNQSQYGNAISVEEARAYYEANQKAYLLPERARVRQIVVTSERDANLILQELEKGSEFEKLAVQESLGPESRFGGDLGYFSRGEMPKEFDVVFSMEKGEISKPIKSPYGVHIFKVEDKTPARQLSFDEAVEDIKKRINAIKVAERYQEWLGGLKRNAKTKINRHLLEYTK